MDVSIPVDALTVISPISAVTVSLSTALLAWLVTFTFVLAFNRAFDVTTPCAVTSTSPFTDSTAPFKVTLPAAASIFTFWSAVAAPPRTIFPWVAPTVIVPLSAVAVNVPAALLSILPFAV